MANFWDAVNGLLSNPATASIGESLLNGLTNTTEQNNQISNLLMQVQLDPSRASDVATAIAAMRGVPAQVMALVNQLPQVAAASMAPTASPSDRAQLAIFIANINAALPSSYFGGTHHHR